MQHESNHKTVPVLIHPEECEQEGWDDPAKGGVLWWTLLSADRTPSHSMTCGVAEIGVGEAGALIKHKHAQAEVYHVLSGEGVVTIEDEAYAVRAGSTMFIPGNLEHGTRNTGQEPLRLFYIFAVDSFAEVIYEFPGLTT